MKKILIIASIFAAAIAVSCQKKEIDQPGAGNKMTFTCVIDPGTKLDIDSQGKTTWEAGDEILIHGEYTKSGYCTTVTLAAEDISADGKTATISLDVDPTGAEGIKPYDRTSSGYSSSLYAAYPASAVLMNDHCYWNTRFTDTNKPLMAGYDDGDKMVFRNLCSVMTFRVSGDFDAYTLTGNSGETVAYNPYQTRIRLKTDGTVSFDPVRDGDECTSEALKAVSGPLVADGTTDNMVCFPTGVSFASGFTIKFIKDGVIQKSASTKTAFSLASGDYFDIGAITKLKDYVAPTHESAIPTDGAYDLSAKETANCYIVYANDASNASKVFKFKAAMGYNGALADNIGGNDDSVVLLWQTYNNATEAADIKVIEAVDYEFDTEKECYYIYFQMPDAIHEGNALIAAKNAAGNIIWSWHIWVPKTEISEATYGLYSSSLMDRYLGALVAATTESVPVESYGLTYQWGRKDPFPGAKRVTSESNAIVNGTGVSVASGTLTLAESIENPTVLGFADGGNWMNESNNELWKDGAKTVYDPCPPGYRVPARVKTQPLHGSDLSTVTGWSDNSAAYYFAMGDPLTVFPYSGYRDDSSPDGIAYPGSRVAIWTAYASSSTRAYHMNVRGGSTHALGETAKSRGGVIRCVVK